MISVCECGRPQGVPLAQEVAQDELVGGRVLSQVGWRGPPLKVAQAWGVGV